MCEKGQDPFHDCREYYREYKHGAPESVYALEFGIRLRLMLVLTVKGALHDER